MNNEITQESASYKIQLLDGSFILGTLKSQPKGNHTKPGKEEEREIVQKIFLPNAVFLYEHADQILKDSKMFLAPVPVHNGFAYSGTSGFENPTIGTYILWWKTCPRSIVLDDNGNISLYFFISGSPLSGRNSCQMVNDKGEVISNPIQNNFLDFGKSFIGINSEFEEAKAICESYTLDEVVEILKKREFND